MSLADKAEATKYAFSSTMAGEAVEKQQEIYHQGRGLTGPSKRDRLYVAHAALQLSIDERIEGSEQQSNYDEVKEFARKQVLAYFDESDPELEPAFPETDHKTRKPDMRGSEYAIESWVEEIEEAYEPSHIDTVLGVAAGGIIPGILAASALDADLKFARYSSRDKGDDKPQDIEGNYENDVILVADDVSDTGETFEAIDNHLREEGAKEIYKEAVNETPLDLIKIITGFR